MVYYARLCISEFTNLSHRRKNIRILSNHVQGSGGYIVAGVFKMLSLGGAGIWYTVDWIRILCDTFRDGNGVELKPW